jgi:BppU N-terminal domain
MLGGSMDYSFVAGDTNSVLTVTCKRADSGAVIDLAGATVSLKWRVDGGTLVTKSMTITDAPNGVCAYTFGTGELVAGIMVAEVAVTIGGKVTTSVEPFRFTVRPTV